MITPIGLETNEADAIRFHWMLNEPEGAQHLLNLLRQGKGSQSDFRRMIDRIINSKEIKPNVQP